MTVLDWIAILGALAWSPHITVLLKNGSQKH